jgi:hypothetical protein
MMEEWNSECRKERRLKNNKQPTSEEDVDVLEKEKRNSRQRTADKRFSLGLFFF